MIFGSFCTRVLKNDDLIELIFAVLLENLSCKTVLIVVSEYFLNDCIVEDLLIIKKKYFEKKYSVLILNYNHLTITTTND